MRQFTDEAGTRWDLFEVSSETLSAGRPDFLPSAFKSGWLVFDNGDERRRLAPFPSEWPTFSVAALRTLLASAERVGTRRTRAPRVFRDPALDSSTTSDGPQELR